MRLKASKRVRLIRQIADRIERAFPGSEEVPASVVIWRNTGTASDDFQDDTEVFEAYMIPEEDYERFVLLTWELSREIAHPNGFSIMVHDLTPDETREYRWEEYRRELRRRREAVRKRRSTEVWKNMLLGYTVTRCDDCCIGEEPSMASEELDEALSLAKKAKLDLGAWIRAAVIGECLSDSGGIKKTNWMKPLQALRNEFRSYVEPEGNGACDVDVKPTKVLAKAA